MKENLAARVARIVSGGLHALVDVVEDAAPEAVMEQAIREIDGAIDDVRAELGRVVANKHLANNRLMEENRKHGDLVEQIEIAVNQGRDDLATAAIAKQMDIEAQIPVLENAITDYGSQEKELEGYVNALQAKKREMRDDLRAFRDSRASAGIGATAAGGVTRNQTDGKVSRASEAFERVLERASGIPASRASADRKSAAQLAELEDLARKNRIQERLASVKANAKSK